MANENDRGEYDHDCRVSDASKGVVLVVRQGNKYGPAYAGQRVLVDESELLNRSTMTACMTLEDAEAAIRAADARRAEASKKVPPIKAAIDEGLARIARDAEERARKKRETEASAPPAAQDPLEAKAAAKKSKKQQ